MIPDPQTFQIADGTVKAGDRVTPVEKKVVVAFLQNQWFKPESVERVRRIYGGTTPEQRAKLNARYLFYKSLTGRRLRSAFGEVCDNIVWEECSWGISTQSSGSFRADIAHMADVMRHFRPNVVLTFGKLATDGYQQTLIHLGFASGGTYLPPRHITAPHPAARHATVPFELKAAAIELASWTNKWWPTGVIY